MGIKNILGISDNKGVECTEDESGLKACRVAFKTKDQLLSTGTNFNYFLDKTTCKAHLQGRQIILDEDEAEVQKTLKRAERDCRGGGSIN